MRERRSPADTPLAIEPERFRQLGHALVDRVADFLGGLPERRVYPSAGPEELRALLHGDAMLPERGADPESLLNEAAEILFENSTFNGHPRFFGYITASPAPIGILGDFLASAVNPNCGGWMLSPMATEIEAQVIRWIADLVGYPRECGGVLVSGGNMANFTCFLAARTAMAPWAVREAGLAADDAQPITVYASGETHTWIQKAADLFGIGTDSIRWIATDRKQRMDMSALRRVIDADVGEGRKPMMVVGTAGSVSTGAVDPLTDIAALCKERGIWFHLDGAYGGFAAAAGSAAPGLEHLHLGDSLAVDPHKWLYAPLEAGCALVKDPAHLRGAFAYHPPYYHFGIEATNYVDLGPQNSRGFRALKVWLGLRHAGREGYARMIGDDIALARRLFELVSAYPELEPYTCELSIATFRYVPEDLRDSVGSASTEEHLDKLNRELLDRLQRGGEAFVSNAVIGGVYVLRACIVNINTTVADIEAVPEIVVRVGREVDSELRSSRSSGSSDQD